LAGLILFELKGGTNLDSLNYIQQVIQKTVRDLRRYAWEWSKGTMRLKAESVWPERTWGKGLEHVKFIEVRHFTDEMKDQYGCTKNLLSLLCINQIPGKDVP
jgi:hypothetical protein